MQESGGDSNRKEGKPKYVPNPDDWKCNLCGNFNFARRERCNRCNEDKSKCIVEKSKSNDKKNDK